MIESLKADYEVRPEGKTSEALRDRLMEIRGVYLRRGNWGRSVCSVKPNAVGNPIPDVG